MADPLKISGIGIADWVTRTIEKVERVGLDDSPTWAAAWLEAYYELGGRHHSVGSKVCPRRAAYGLWFLGRIQGCRLRRASMGVQETLAALGRNVTYAVLAADVCIESPDVGVAEVWRFVKQRFRQETGEVPAQSEQGQAQIAVGLANAGLLHPGPVTVR